MVDTGAKSGWKPASGLTLVMRRPCAESIWLAKVGFSCGLRCFEVTCSTPDWRETLAELGQALPDAELGVGSLLDKRQIELAADAGADFLVTPALVPGASDVATDRGLPLVQGAATPSEVLRAHLDGSDLVKIFPAARLGGPAFLRDLLAPMPSLRLMPSGGIAASAVREYFTAGAVAVSIGSGIAAPAQLDERDDDAVRRAFEEALAR